MREIKFRWSGVIEGERSMRPHAVLGVHLGASVVELEEDEGSTYALENGVFEQFTGLKDKNGVEIYEGDICRALPTGVAGYIVFHNGRFAWTDGACHWDIIENSTRDHCPIDAPVEIAEDLEIMGNLHEHKELLK